MRRDIQLLERGVLAVRHMEDPSEYARVTEDQRALFKHPGYFKYRYDNVGVGWAINRADDQYKRMILSRPTARSDLRRVLYRFTYKDWAERGNPRVRQKAYYTLGEFYA